MKINRHKTRTIHLGGLSIGGKNPVSIQSMTKVPTGDIKAVIKQIHKLEKAGCEIIRAAVPDIQTAESLGKIIKEISIPLVADIHFDYRLAVKSIEQGAAGIRINPGNIGGSEKVYEVIKLAKERKSCVRIGVNSGSLDKKWLARYKGVTVNALVASAVEYVKIIEDMGFTNMKVSLKAPDIYRTIEAYRLISRKIDYPLHIGVTEAGPVTESAVKSSIALGALLMEGIGDTIRVSVTGDPVDEVIIAKEILQSLGLRNFGPQIISCPTCGRCEVDLVEIVTELKRKLYTINCKMLTPPPKIAVMGCIVNGPGEAKEADIGIACGKGSGVLFRKGKIVKKVSEDKIVKCLLKELIL